MRRFLLAALIAPFIISAAAAEDDPNSEMKRMMDLFMNKMADRAPYWRCETTTKYMCTAEGCEPTEPLLWSMVNFESGDYQRCDSSGCDDYKMTSGVDMMHTIITLTDRGGSFMAVLNDGSEFAETVSLETKTYNSFGACAPVEK
jgi:hypothetical protein